MYTPKKKGDENQNEDDQFFILKKGKERMTLKGGSRMEEGLILFFSLTLFFPLFKELLKVKNQVIGCSMR